MLVSSERGGWEARPERAAHALALRSNVSLCQTVLTFRSMHLGNTAILFHLDLHPHPGMDAALKAVQPLLQAAYLQAAPLNQASSLEIRGLKKGLHRFQCCVHPWMRMEIEVK